MLQVSASVGDSCVARLRLRALQHFFGDVDAENLRRAVFPRPSAEPPEAAAEINHLESAQIRQHRAQGRPFGRPCETFDGTREPAVLLEELLPVVDVLRHRASSKPKECRASRVSCQLNDRSYGKSDR